MLAVHSHDAAPLARGTLHRGESSLAIYMKSYLRECSTSFILHELACLTMADLFISAVNGTHSAVTTPHDDYLKLFQKSYSRQVDPCYCSGAVTKNFCHSVKLQRDL